MQSWTKYRWVEPPKTIFWTTSKTEASDPTEITGERPERLAICKSKSHTVQGGNTSEATALLHLFLRTFTLASLGPFLEAESSEWSMKNFVQSRTSTIPVTWNQKHANETRRTLPSRTTGTLEILFEIRVLRISLSQVRRTEIEGRWCTRREYQVRQRQPSWQQYQSLWRLP